MGKPRVLFFAADPLAVLPNGRTPALQLGQDVREVRERVEAAGHASVLELDWRLAARTDDLVSALRQTRPTVVHFSGHGGNDGLVLTATGGHGAQLVSPEALTRIFQVFPHSVRLVVLSACCSQAQAEAICQVVECAIGTSGQIADADAIRFNAAFYAAIASGESVQAAFDQASAQIGLAPRLALFSRKGVDPGRVFVVPRFRRLKRIAAATALVFLFATLIASWPPPPPTPPHHLRGVQLGDCETPGTRRVMEEPGPAAGAATSGASSEAATDLAEAKALCGAENYEAAFPLLKRAADAGSLEAAGLVGIAYLTGEGTPPEPEHGAELLRDAAGKGDLRSMRALAAAYQNGYGVKRRDLHWAKFWLRKAAVEGGDAEAMRRLGVIYRDAHSDSARYWLPRAVAAGSLDARVDLGFMYALGIMVPRDTAEASRLYRSAAEAGSARGRFALGTAYQTGFGVRQDHVLAHRWYRRAACAGSADAMNAIGVEYLQGLGVAADRDEAIRWFRLAAAEGSEVAAGNLRALRAAGRPRRWKGPVARVLAWLSLSGSQPRLACASPPTHPGTANAAPVAERRLGLAYAQGAASPSDSRVISIIVRRKPARAKRRCAGSLRSAVESTTRGAPRAFSAARVASSSIRPTPWPRSAGSTTMS